MHERVSDWVIQRPTSSQMLQNMGLTCVVIRGGPEENGWNIVCISTIQVDVLSLRSDMLEFVSTDIEVLDIINWFYKPLVMDLITNFQGVRLPLFSPQNILWDFQVLQGYFWLLKNWSVSLDSLESCPLSWCLCELPDSVLTSHHRVHLSVPERLKSTFLKSTLRHLHPYWRPLNSASQVWWQKSIASAWRQRSVFVHLSS